MKNRLEQAKGFGEYLVGKATITHAGLSRILAAIGSTNHPLDTVLVELGLMQENLLAEHFADYLQAPVFASENVAPNADLLDRIGFDFCSDAAVLPVENDENQVILALADPILSDAPEMISYLLDQPVQLRCASRSRIASLLQQCKEEAVEHSESEAVFETGDLGSDDIDRLKDIANEAPIIRLVTAIVQEAVDRNATDIHIEPFEDSVDIRMRHDGMLTVSQSISKQLHAGLSTRLKILSRLNIAERRLPQDGRMRMSVRGQEIDMRVSVLSSVHGETFVLRILDRTAIPLRLDALGYGKADVEKLRRLAQLNNGIVLITGPTGSGKTTTLYSMINEIDTRHVKVFTVEDPVEYRMDGITQVQVNSAIELDFSKTLRTVLRQDPDVILVGEIRDPETARIAIRAALTGHLVLSTLHTNSAAGAFSRLVDMGIEPYLLADTIRAVVGQRLLRAKCKACSDLEDPGACRACQGTGYNGRVATYEILEVSADIAQQIHNSENDVDIVKRARRDGFKSLSDHATGLVTSGVTDRPELQRVLNSGGM